MSSFKEASFSFHQATPAKHNTSSPVLIPACHKRMICHRPSVSDTEAQVSVWMRRCENALLTCWIHLGHEPWSPWWKSLVCLSRPSTPPAPCVDFVPLHTTSAARGVLHSCRQVYSENTRKAPCVVFKLYESLRGGDKSSVSDELGVRPSWYLCTKRGVHLLGWAGTTEL